MKDIKLTVKLLISKEAQRLGISNSITCFIDNISVMTGDNYLEEEVKLVTTLCGTNRGAIYDTDCYIGFKSLFTKLGYPNQTTACDRLINYYSKKGFKSINNIVDSYNLCSVLFGSPIGLHDSKNINNNIIINIAKGIEEILPMFKPLRKKINSGDLIYQTDGNTLCWMGKEDIDSDEYKVTDKTNSIFIMAIGNEKTTSNSNRAICRKIYDLIKKSCPSAIFHEIPTIVLD